jgi:hypothetical protein
MLGKVPTNTMNFFARFVHLYETIFLFSLCSFGELLGRILLSFEHCLVGILHW